jgi:hypothetical protein
MLPTDRALRADSGIDSTARMGAFLDGPLKARNSETPPLGSQDPPLELKSLLRPRVEFFAEWEPESEGLTISSYDLSTKMPLYPIFGPPPPLISAGLAENWVKSFKNRYFLRCQTNWPAYGTRNRCHST